MDAIKQVTDSEQQAKALVAQAQAQAKQLLQQAQKDGEAALAAARKEAQDRVRERMDRAEAAGAEKTRQTLEQYETDCRALKAKAEGRLDKAAEMIVGKVVKG